jgi:hypothetical protein
MSTSTYRTVTLTTAEGALRDAKAAYEWALRHGNPGDVSRARRYLREAQQAVAG